VSTSDSVSASLSVPSRLATYRGVLGLARVKYACFLDSRRLFLLSLSLSHSTSLSSESSRKLVFFVSRALRGESHLFGHWPPAFLLSLSLSHSTSLSDPRDQPVFLVSPSLASGVGLFCNGPLAFAATYWLWLSFCGSCFGRYFCAFLGVSLLAFRLGCSFEGVLRFR
jgi:hypothetical protein